MADYFVRTSGGSDVNDGLSVANGFDTITRAVDPSLVAGDTVSLCVMAAGEKFDSEPLYPVQFTRNGSNADGMIQFTGANSSGVVDGTIAIVDAGGPTAVLQITFGDLNYFQYISTIGGVIGWDISDVLYNTFWRCEARDNTDSGFDCNTSAHSKAFIECLAEDCGTEGFLTSPVIDSAMIDCVARNNSTVSGLPGFSGSSFLTATNSNRSVCFRCLAYNTTGVQDSGFRKISIVANCVAHNHAGDGMEMSSSQTGRHHIVVDSLFTENAAYGISDDGAFGLFFNNAFFSNPSGEIQTNPVTEGIELNSLTLSDSPFEDDSNDDFTLNNNRAGLLPRRDIYQGEWIKKPANLVENGTFDNDTFWIIGTGWTIANGVAHHSVSIFVLEYLDIITDGVLYETIFTVSNYVSGTVRINAGNTLGTDRTANGTYREILTGANPTPESSEKTLFFSQTTDFVGDIDDVLVAPVNSGPQGTRGSGGSRMTSHGARGAARPKDRRIKTG